MASLISIIESKNFSRILKVSKSVEFVQLNEEILDPKYSNKKGENT